MKAVVSKALSSLLKEQGGREAVRDALRVALSRSGDQSAVLQREVGGQSRRITVRIEAVRD